MGTYGEKMFDPEEHDNYNRKIQEQQQKESQDQNDTPSKKKPEIDPNLTYEERKKIRDNNFKMPIRENLKFKTMAQYKVLQDGDTFQYDMIENHLIERPSLKALALSSRSIKQFEKVRDNHLLRSGNVSLEGSQDY